MLNLKIFLAYDANKNLVIVKVKILVMLHNWWIVNSYYTAMLNMIDAITS